LPAHLSNNPIDAAFPVFRAVSSIGSDQYGAWTGPPGLRNGRWRVFGVLGWVGGWQGSYRAAGALVAASQCRCGRPS
jgi:integration host factor subunit beta